MKSIWLEGRRAKSSLVLALVVIAAARPVALALSSVTWLLFVKCINIELMFHITLHPVIATASSGAIRALASEIEKSKSSLCV